MKLQQIVENEGGSELALILKLIKSLGLTASLKNRTKHMHEDGVRAATAAIRNGVTEGYWNYVSTGANAAKVGGEIRTMSWALSNMHRTNSAELPFFKETAKLITLLDARLDDVTGLLKSMEATHLCITEIVKKVSSKELEPLEKKMALAVLTKLGVINET